MNMHLRGASAWIGAAAMLTAAGMLAACATSRDHTQGLTMISSGDREQGLAKLAAASAAEPSNSQYRLDYLKQLSLSVNALLAQGDETRRAGKLDDATQWYQSTLRIDAGNDRALRGLSNIEMDRRHNELLARAEKLLAAHDVAGARQLVHTVLQENGARSDAKALATRIADEMDRIEAARVAQVATGSVMKKPVSLQFRDANLRMVFEALSRTTGLNVIFDRDVRNDLKTTIFVHDASVEDTVGMILLQSQLEKKELNANTLFIYPATAAKQKEYQDLKVRVFQLSNADGKVIQTVLKTVLKVADMSLDEKTNTLVVRGTPDTIAVAEKIIAAHDFPDPEVMLEVEVLEVSRERLLNLGINWPTSFGVATPNTVSTIHDLNHLPLNQLTVTSLSATLNAQLQDTDANILAAPKLRTRDNQKAKILIGDKVPVITNTVTPVASGSPVVTGSVQYLDVGIKLEVKPHVYLEGDVGIEMSLEVSNIVKQIPGPNGSLAYQIGTRDATTNLRLRDGETQILAGLIQDQYNRAADKVPGLGQFPILGHLFRSDNTDDKKTEIVLSITPHILRAPTVADARQRNVFTGTESAVREVPLRLDPVGSVSGAPSSPGAPTPGFVGGGGSPNPVAPQNLPLTPDPGRSKQAVPPGIRRDPRLPEGMNTVRPTPPTGADAPPPATPDSN